MTRDPNRPVSGVSHPDDPRYTDPVGTGKAAKDGFTRLGRRPRTPLVDECMPLDRADRIEDMTRGLGRTDNDY